MNRNLLMGLWRLMLPIPPALWKKTGAGGGDPLGFMTEDHHRVRDWAVLELARSGEALTPERIAQELELPQPRVVAILDDLERHKTFLFRNAQGAVTWAYPVTVDPTPHRVRFSTGKQVHAA
jgi:hypothetical protein